MPFKKGEKRPPNAGRKRGQPNKITRTLRETILQALENVGGVEYLEQQAKRNPGPFMALVGKVLPLQLKEGGAEPSMPGVMIKGFPDLETFRKAQQRTDTDA